MSSIAVNTCKHCGSHAINQNLYGRIPGELLDLCDVHYFKFKLEKLQEKYENLRQNYRNGTLYFESRE